MQLLATFLAADPWIIRWAALVNECETERDEENTSERMIAPRCDVKAGTTQVRAGEPRRRAKRSKAMWRGSEEAKKRRRRRLEEATSRAQPRPVCNLPNDLQHSGINNHGRSESYETVRCGGILFKNNCVPSCDGFLCLITANCSEFTSIMARLTRRLCNGRECIRKREREREWNRPVVPQATAIPVCARSPSEEPAARDANRPPSAFPRGPRTGSPTNLSSSFPPCYWANRGIVVKLPCYRAWLVATGWYQPWLSMS